MSGVESVARVDNTEVRTTSLTPATATRTVRKRGRLARSPTTRKSQRLAQGMAAQGGAEPRGFVDGPFSNEMFDNPLTPSRGSSATATATAAVAAAAARPPSNDVGADPGPSDAANAEESFGSSLPADVHVDIAPKVPEQHGVPGDMDKDIAAFATVETGERRPDEADVPVAQEPPLPERQPPRTPPSRRRTPSKPPSDEVVNLLSSDDDSKPPAETNSIPVESNPPRATEPSDEVPDVQEVRSDDSNDDGNDDGNIPVKCSKTPVSYTRAPRTPKGSSVKFGNDDTPKAVEEDDLSPLHPVTPERQKPPPTNRSPRRTAELSSSGDGVNSDDPMIVDTAASLGRVTRAPKSSAVNESVEDIVEQQSLLADASPAKNAGRSPRAAANDIGVQGDEVSAVPPAGDSQNVADEPFVVEDNDTNQARDAGREGNQDDVTDDPPLADQPSEIVAMANCTLEVKPGEAADQAEAEAVKSPTSHQSQDDLNTRMLFSFPPTGRGNIRVRYEDYKRVANHEYLNDTVIDFNLKVLQAELRTVHPERQYGDSLYFFSTFFFSRLRPNPTLNLKEVDYDGVKRWTANVDLFAKRFIFVPICESLHWSIIIAANFDKLERCSKDKEYFEGLSEQETPRFVYLDSLEPRRAKQFGRTMLSYFVHEFVERKLEGDRTEELIFETFENLKHLIHVHNPYVPLQTNEVDCGLYLLHNIRCFLENTDGFQDKCLEGLVDVRGKKLHVKCRNLYTHSDIHRLRFEVLQTISQFEWANATDQGNVPDEHASLLCDKLPEKEVPVEEEEVEAAHAQVAENDKFDAACVVAALGAEREGSDDVLVVNETQGARQPRRSRRLKEIPPSSMYTSLGRENMRRQSTEEIVQEARSLGYGSRPGAPTYGASENHIEMDAKDDPDFEAPRRDPKKIVPRRGRNSGAGAASSSAEPEAMDIDTPQPMNVDQPEVVDLDA